MDTISNFSSFIELIGAINFSLMAYHVLSYNDNTFKGFHYILSEFTNPFFKRHLDYYNGLVSGQEDLSTLDNKIIKSRKWLEIQQQRLKTTHGFTNSCLISGISAMIILLFIGFIDSNKLTNSYPLFTSFLIFTIIFLLMILFIDVFFYNKKMFKTPFHMIVFYLAFLIIGYLYFKFCISELSVMCSKAINDHVLALSLILVSWSLVMYLGRYTMIFCLVYIRNAKFSVLNKSGIREITERNEMKMKKLENLIG